MKNFYILLIILLSFFIVSVANAENLNERLKGKILLQVEDVGQAWYIEPETKERAFLGRPADAFRIMRELGLGVSEKDYNLFNGYAPSRLSGKILLRVEANGEAYYIFPDDLKMYYLGKPSDAFNVMREKGLGITDKDLEEVPVFEKYKEQVEENTDAIEELTKKLGEQQSKIDELEEKLNAETATSTDSCTVDIWVCKAWSECSSDGQQTRTCDLNIDCPNVDTPSPATTQSCSYTPTVIPTPDPEINITLGNIITDSSSAYIEWDTNLPTDSKIFFTRSDGSTRVISSISGNSTKHIVNILNLVSGTQYSYTIEAIADAQSKQKDGSFTTQPQLFTSKAIILKPTDVPSLNFYSDRAFTIKTLVFLNDNSYCQSGFVAAGLSPQYKIGNTSVDLINQVPKDSTDRFTINFPDSDSSFSLGNAVLDSNGLHISEGDAIIRLSFGASKSTENCINKGVKFILLGSESIVIGENGQQINLEDVILISSLD